MTSNELRWKFGSRRLGHRRGSVALRFGFALSALVLVQLPAAFAQRAIVPKQVPAWIGTWGSSPMRDDSGREFTHQTLRQIVHVTVGGSIARLHFSNVFGKQALTLEDVRIAFRKTGPSILPGSERQILFGGRSTITIAPGDEVTSDPVEFAVPALTDLAVSTYLPGTAGPITYHASAHRTSYIAAGDVSGLATLPETKTTRSYYILTAIDIRDRKPQSHPAGRQQVRGTLVTLGASITEGYRSTSNTNRSWPSDLAQRLIDAGFDIGVVNQGISGNRLLASGAGPDAEERFQRDVLGGAGVRWVIFSDDPINDLGSTKPPPSAAALIGGIRQLITLARARNVKFFCSTLTPYQGANYWTAEEEVTRERVNAFIRSGESGCDGIIDQDLATHDPAHPTQFLPAYDSGDHLHPNDAGHQAIADAVNLSLFWQP